jgi:hypothetical protein
MKRSMFNLSHTHLSSFDMGELVPIMVRPVLQGDIWDMSTSAMVRMSPLVSPPMHPTHITIHHWFVPNRIMWNNDGGPNTGFEAFITGGPAGTSAPTHPYIVMPNSGAGGVVVGNLANYLGVPLGYNNDNTGYKVSALPFRAYAMIWNYFYRDEDLQTELVVDKTDGADTTTNTALQNVCWEEDYFTVCRSSPQKGPEVTISLTGNAPVIMTDSNNPTKVRQALSHGTNLTGSNFPPLNTSGQLSSTNGAGGTLYQIDPADTLEADMSSLTGIPIIDLRYSNAAQRFMEKMSRQGSRFAEWLMSFGLKFSGATIDVPQYLGGGKQTIQFSEVLATAETDDTPIGTLKGHGIAGISTNRFTRYFEEPGFIISLASIKPKTIYSQGLERFWNYETKFDYWTPEMQFIGQMAVLKKEVYAAHTDPNGTFGYVDRNEDERYAQSRVSGEFLTTQNTWHFARNFSSSPVLNGDFVKSVPTDLPFADQASDTCLVTFQHKIRRKTFVTANPTPKLL